jgi:hypothetical protein
MVRLLKTLAQEPSLQWPGMGSEVIVEVYKTPSQDVYTRILANGKTLLSSANQLAGTAGGESELDWVSGAREEGGGKRPVIAGALHCSPICSSESLGPSSHLTVS